jgi:DNA invertase Pin-like site-specific DNA recombinase
VRPIRHLRPEDLAGKRWRGLVRESTEAQADRWSPDRQRADIERAATELGMVGDGVWYERTGSGEAVDASELRQALADAGQFDVLVAFHTSRFARNRAEATRMKAEFRKAGIILYFASQRLISGTFVNALAEGINEVLDEHANEERRLWIAGGIRERQKSGRWLGHLPYGYGKAMADFPDGSRKWDGELEPDPIEAPIVRRIFAALLAGKSERDIARALNDEGTRTRQGRPWGRHTVGEIARNPVYAGRYIRYRTNEPDRYFDTDDAQDGRQTIRDDVPAIVTVREWETIQKARLGSNPGKRSAYPMSGIARCKCGRKMTGMHNARSVRYYRCEGRHTRGDCNAPSIRADALEGAFGEWFDGYELRDDWRDALRRMDFAASRPDEEARRARLTAQLPRLRELYQWGDMAEAEYREKTAQIKADLALGIIPQVAAVEGAAAALGHLGTLWAEKAETAEAAAVVRSILTGVIIEDGTVRDWIVRPELRPLLDELCVYRDSDTCRYTGRGTPVVRYA